MRGPAAITAVFIAFFALAPPLLAQGNPSQCAQYEEVRKKLLEKYNEVPTSYGIYENQGSLFTIFESVPKTDKAASKLPTWSVTATDGKGKTCINASGQFWAKTTPVVNNSASPSTLPPEKLAMARNMRDTKGCYYDTSLNAILQTFEVALDQTLSESGIMTPSQLLRPGDPKTQSVIAVLTADDNAWTMLEIAAREDKPTVRGCVRAKGVDWEKVSPPDEMYIEAVE